MKWNDILLAINSNIKKPLNLLMTEISDEKTKLITDKIDTRHNSLINNIADKAKLFSGKMTDSDNKINSISSLLQNKNYGLNAIKNAISSANSSSRVKYYKPSSSVYKTLVNSKIDISNKNYYTTLTCMAEFTPLYNGMVTFKYDVQNPDGSSALDDNTLRILFSNNSSVQNQNQDHEYYYNNTNLIHAYCNFGVGRNSWWGSGSREMSESDMVILYNSYYTQSNRNSITVPVISGIPMKIFIQNNSGVHLCYCNKLQVLCSVATS